MANFGLVAKNFAAEYIEMWNGWSPKIRRYSFFAMSRAMLAVVPYSFAAVKPAPEQPHRSQVSIKTQKKASRSSTAGFGAKKREPLWQCVKNCGACCKLDKGPAFPSPEEIFDDPSDIQVLSLPFSYPFLNFNSYLCGKKNGALIMLCFFSQT